MSIQHKPIGDLENEAYEIRHASSDNFNDAERVGELFDDIVAYLKFLDSGSGGLGSFLSELNTAQGLTLSHSPGQTIVLDQYNQWGFGDAGGGGGSFPAGSVLASLLQNGSSPGNTLEDGYVIKWNGTKWVYGEGGTGGDISSCLTKTAYSASRFWGRSPALTSGENPHYEVTGPLSGGIEYIEFKNGVRIGVNSNSDDSTIKVYRENTIDPTTQEPVTHVGHIYATGGVSALGNSSGGGGGGGGGLTANSWAEFFDGISHQGITDTDGYLRLVVGGTSENPTYTLDWATPTGNLPAGGSTGDYLSINSQGNPYWTSASPGGGLTQNSWASFFNTISHSGITESNGKYLKVVVNGSGTSLAWDVPTGNLPDPTGMSGMFLSVNSSNQPYWTSAPSGTGGVSAITVNSYAFVGSGDTANLLGSGVVSLTASNSNLTFSISTSGANLGDVLSVGSNGAAWSSFSSLLGQRTLWGNTDAFNNIGYTTGSGSEITVHTASLNYVQELTMYGNINMLSTNTSEGAEINMGGGSGNIHLDNYKDANNNSADALSFRIFTEGVGNCNFEYYPLQGGAIIGPGHTGSYLQIGNVKIIEESGNTLKIECANGNAGHLYATGGISALGLSSGSSPSIGNLTVTDKLTLQSTDNTKGLTFTDGTNTTPLYMNDGNLTVGGSGISFGSGVYANTSGFHATNLYATRVYLQTDPNDVYLYWHVEENNNRLRLVVGTTEYDISTSQVPTS